MDPSGSPQKQRDQKRDYHPQPVAQLRHPSTENGIGYPEHKRASGARRYPDYTALPSRSTIGQTKAVQPAEATLQRASVKRAAYEVAQVLERNHESLSKYCNNSWEAKNFHALRTCRTAALGGHIERCNNPSCHSLHLSYNSCRNRHCPKCQGHKKEAWIRAREEELLNVPYFHVVFTLPQELNRPCL